MLDKTALSLSLSLFSLLVASMSHRLKALPIGAEHRTPSSRRSTRINEGSILRGNFSRISFNFSLLCQWWRTGPMSIDDDSHTFPESITDLSNREREEEKTSNASPLSISRLTSLASGSVVRRTLSKGPAPLLRQRVSTGRSVFPLFPRETQLFD